MYLVGIKKDKFEDRNSGKVIEYGQLYTIEPRKNVRGYGVQVHKVSTKILDALDELEPGCFIDMHYDSYGKVCFVEQVAPEENEIDPDVTFA